MPELLDELLEEDELLELLELLLDEELLELFELLELLDELLEDELPVSPPPQPKGGGGKRESAISLV